MSAESKDGLREAFLSGVEPSGELERRFNEQVATVLRRRLRRWEKWLRGSVAVIFAAGAVGQAWGGFLFLSHKSLGIRTEVALTVGCLFLVGAAVLLFGAAGLVYEIRAGRVAPRKMQKAIVGLAMVPVIVFSVLALMYVPRMNLPLNSQIYIFVSVLFFWIMLHAHVILARADWNRQDIILEQKRTQLQIAVLREEMAGTR